MPSKASRPNGNGNGNGGCKRHPAGALACRPCLLLNLQEFRHANLRAGIHLATERVKKLRSTYLSADGRQIKVSDVAVALTTLLGELETAEKKVGELPVDVGVVLRATLQANRHGVRC